MNFPNYLIKLLISYLKNRRFRVKLGDTLTDPKAVNDCVPQGSILGPLLFILFMLDLPKHANTILSSFADDTNLFSTRTSQKRAKSNVQSQLSKRQSYFQKWKVKVNVD